jgi:hypothetical protein
MTVGKFMYYSYLHQSDVSPQTPFTAHRLVTFITIMTIATEEVGLMLERLRATTVN